METEACLFVYLFLPQKSGSLGIGRRTNLWNSEIIILQPWSAATFDIGLTVNYHPIHLWRTHKSWWRLRNPDPHVLGWERTQMPLHFTIKPWQHFIILQFINSLQETRTKTKNVTRTRTRTKQRHKQERNKNETRTNHQ